MRAIAIVLVAILVVTTIGAVSLWRRAGVDIPLIGWVAIGVGALVTLLLGGGLMALSFYSSRHGFDDRQRPEDEE